MTLRPYVYGRNEEAWMYLTDATWLCLFQNLEPFINHSRQNLALGMKTFASSTDDYHHCKDKRCKKAPACSQLVVDGNFQSCFLSLTEYRPWLTVYLNGLHPIALVTVVPGDSIYEPLIVYAGNTYFSLRETCWHGLGVRWWAVSQKPKLLQILHYTVSFRLGFA